MSMAASTIKLPLSPNCGPRRCWGRVVDTCLQLHGGWGYMLEYPIARAFADARVERIAGGSSEVLREINRSGHCGARAMTRRLRRRCCAHSTRARTRGWRLVHGCRRSNWGAAVLQPILGRTGLDPTLVEDCIFSVARRLSTIRARISHVRPGFRRTCRIRFRAWS